MPAATQLREANRRVSTAVPAPRVVETTSMVVRLV
jgi:hypothetical protein